MREMVDSSERYEVYRLRDLWSAIYGSYHVQVNDFARVHLSASCLGMHGLCRRPDARSPFYSNSHGFKIWGQSNNRAGSNY